MLVLALQFSRGGVAHAEHRVDLLETSSTQRRRREVEFPLPQNGREDGDCRRFVLEGGTESLSTSRSERLTVHQCTNRCVSSWIVRMTTFSREALLRKEVIQPHLPVRLPCYDFTPITDPTFDGSLPYGLGHRLRVLPTFVV